MKFYHLPFYPLIGTFIYCATSMSIVYGGVTENWALMLSSLAVSILYWVASVATAPLMARHALQQYVARLFDPQTLYVSPIRGAYNEAIAEFAVSDAYHIAICRLIQFAIFSFITSVFLKSGFTPEQYEASAWEQALALLVIILPDMSIYMRSWRRFRGDLAYWVACRLEQTTFNSRNTWRNQP